MMWSYVEGVNEKGDPILVGPYNSHREAQKVADKEGYGDAQVLEYPTRSLTRATSMWKKEEADKEGGSIKKAMKRVRHPKVEAW